MAYTPEIDDSQIAPLLATLEELRREINALDVPEPLARWLRERVEARGAHMSTSIEGNPMTEPEVRALFAQERGATSHAEAENLDYRDAARFAQNAGEDFGADIDEGFVRALQFIGVRTTDRAGTAGQLRQEQNRVADSAGRTVYLPPAPGEVQRALADLIVWLRAERGTTHPLILAAVAHLEFVNIHPSDDGNGRTARALTVYFSTRGNWRLHGLARTEAAFGRDRMRYYTELQRFGAAYPPSTNDVTGWCAWFLRSFAIEIATAIGIVNSWAEFRSEMMPDTTWGRAFGDGYMYLALQRSVSSAEYVRATRVSSATAVKQLNAMVVNGIVRRSGRGPSTRYELTSDDAGEYAYDAYAAAIKRLGEP